ncbi:MAG TPA: hypothetical protein VNE40_03165 [Candidatus Dormibacteraeota bacterium]|nr:hypothetical protein [Candidatus Dormibacteraeota bacterium]
MPDKKAAPQAPSEEQRVESRVDAMMDSKLPDIKAASTPINNSTLPPIDIFKNPETAPQLPKGLLDEAGAEISTPGLITNATDSTKMTDQEEDPLTVAAVDSITSQESDDLLAVSDAAETKTESPKKRPPKSMLGKIFKHKWLWLVGIPLVLIALGAWPTTRYKLVGLVLKHNFSISVVDSTTGTPVSSATVQVDGKTAKTDGNGRVVLKLPVGHSWLSVHKQYYKDSGQSILVPFLSSKGSYGVKLIATGRQVPIVVLDKITGQGVVGADIKVLTTEAKTGPGGLATIVLPTTTGTQTASIQMSNYNPAQVIITVTDKIVSANSFSITPAGTIYFLSNASGTIDVVKSNLDGTNRSTVLPGTGKEDPNGTVLLAARDWKYLVLKASRDSSQPALYLIDTSDDKVTQFDSGNASFNLIGWDNHDFVYDSTLNSVPGWQVGHEQIKSYDADTGQLNVLDQNQATGDVTTNASQSFSGFYILNSGLIYNVTWYGNAPLSGKSDTIRGVQANGIGKQDYKTFDANQTSYITAQLFQPNNIYYAVYYNDGTATGFYDFANGALKSDAQIDQSSLSQSYPTYLISPSGNQTFWTELRDGKNSLFVGDTNAQNPKQILSSSDYSPYGWFSDAFTLVSKNGSQLYILPSSELSSTVQPLKITDYYKSAQAFNGYGYGYGGL